MTLAIRVGYGAFIGSSGYPSFFIAYCILKLYVAHYICRTCRICLSHHKGVNGTFRSNDNTNIFTPFEQSHALSHLSGILLSPCCRNVTFNVSPDHPASRRAVEDAYSSSLMALMAV